MALVKDNIVFEFIPMSFIVFEKIKKGQTQFRVLLEKGSSTDNKIGIKREVERPDNRNYFFRSTNV